MSETSLKERAREELRNYAVVAAYLYVCFGAILFYKMALVREEGVAFLPHGLAAIKALILGKFILIGEAVGIGKVHGHSLAETIAEFREHLGLELLATSFLMLLILIPLIAFKELRQRKIL